MWPDVTVIPPLTCGLLKDRLVEVDLWLSGGGTKSILHKDAYNAINCLYNGTKEWKMIEYKYEDKIYKAWEPPQMVGGYSRINVQSVDLLKYPKVSEVPWSFVTVHAGDCLFLPKSKSCRASDITRWCNFLYLLTSNHIGTDNSKKNPISHEKSHSLNKTDYKLLLQLKNPKIHVISR